MPNNGTIYLTLNGEILFVQGHVDGIAPDDTFSMIGEESDVGDEAGITVQMWNPQADGGELAVTLEAEGRSYPLAASPGEQSQQRITLSPVRDSSWPNTTASTPATPTGTRKRRRIWRVEGK